MNTHTLRQTPLHDVHAALGARMIDFGGWHMPVQYGPILDEVKCVREACGLFDLGHMGRFHVVGPDAVKLCDNVATNFVEKIPVGAIRYALFCQADGNPIDEPVRATAATVRFDVTNLDDGFPSAATLVDR